MARRTGKKVESLVTDAEYAIMDRHRRFAHLPTMASYIRAAGLAGLPRRNHDLDRAIGELSISINRLSSVVAAGHADDAARLLPSLKKLAKSLQCQARSSVVGEP